MTLLKGRFMVERQYSVKVTSKGQITVPAEFRRRLGIKQGDVLIIRDSAAGYIIEKAASGSKFDAFVGHLAKDGPRNTDDIMREMRGSRKDG